MTRSRLALLAFSVVFIALAWLGAGARGIIAEEAQPYLERYPVVLEPDSAGGVARMPPYEGSSDGRPRWVTTSQWPVVAYDGANRMWPVFIRGHQTAIGSYVGIALGPLLGGGIGGVRRADAILALGIVLLAALTASRLGSRAPPIAAGLLALSFGMIALARTGYGFELASRVGMMSVLAILARAGPISARRALAAGFLAAVALLCRATIGTAFAPAVLVLVARAERRPAIRAALLVALPATILPIVVVLAFRAMVPFRADASPLATLPAFELGDMASGLVRQAVLSLAWLGDATSIYGPLARGSSSLGASLAWSAPIAMIPLILASIRWVRRTAETGEKMFVASFAGCALGGAVLYRDASQFQLALALEPLFAIAVAEQLLALASWKAGIGRAAMLLAFLVRAQSTARGLALDTVTANPMLSGAAQRAAVARARSLGLSGPELMTTVYNQAGVLEAWTGGEIRPIHAWPLFSGADDCTRVREWRAALERYRPRYVLLTEGPNLFESGGMNASGIVDSLHRAANLSGVRIGEAERFPTESSGPGWALVRLDLPSELLHGEDSACPSGPASVIASFHGIRTGDRIAALTVDAVEAHGDGARVRAVAGSRHASFDIVHSNIPSPPASGGGFAILYRNEDVGTFTQAELVEAATAIATRLEQEGR